MVFFSLLPYTTIFDAIVGRICLLGFRLRPSRKTVWGSWQRERSTKGLSRNSIHCHSAVSVRTSVQERAAMRTEATF